MKERLRAPLAAAVALLIGGDLAALGAAGVIDAWRFLFPYLWLFLALEAARRRRRLGDVEAFLLGAAVGLVYDGAYAKNLQSGIAFLGIDWLAALTACFDWGLVTVVSLHAADALLPRPDAESGGGSTGWPERLALVLIPAGAFVAYLADVSAGRTQVERLLGPAWLFDDLLFLAAAALLVRRAFFVEGKVPLKRDRRLWALGFFCGWLPGAQMLARAAEPWPFPSGLVLVALWTAAVAVAARRLWTRMADVAAAPRRISRPLLAVAAWRLAGAAVLLALLGPAVVDERTAAAFSLFVDLPTRLVFLSVFLSANVGV